MPKPRTDKRRRPVLRVGTIVVAPDNRLEGALLFDALEVARVHSDGTLDIRRAADGPGHNPPVEWVRVDPDDVKVIR